MSRSERRVHRRDAILMDTHVTIEVVEHDPTRDWDSAIERALGWFREVEARCSRFDPASEVMQLAWQVGRPTPVSPLLFEAVRFALEVARSSDGAFDPTVGHVLEARGFNRNYRTGQVVRSGIAPPQRVDWRQVRLDPERQTITLLRPLVLDLGAVAKGLAIDLAARELAGCDGAVIDAGGDLSLRGTSSEGRPWRVGIRHPREPGKLIAVLQVTDVAVCTSGDYERRAPGAEQEHHIVDPRTGGPSAAVASVTVVAPTALAADALGTAAFVLGPERGIRLLATAGVEGLIVDSALARWTTTGFARYEEWQS